MSWPGKEQGCCYTGQSPAVESEKRKGMAEGTVLGEPTRKGTVKETHGRNTNPNAKRIKECEVIRIY